MKTYINENSFYTNGEAEHYKYCNYQFKVHDREDGKNGILNFDMFALIDNSNPMYIRLCKCRNGRLSPCGYGQYPSIDGRFASLSNEERDSQCPKIAWGFIAFFLHKLEYVKELREYVPLFDNEQELFNEYYSIWLDAYMTKHRGMKYRSLSDEDKEQLFIKEHLENEANLKERSTPLKSYEELFGFACEYYNKYKAWLVSKIKEDSELTDGGFILPKELDTDKARSIFAKAIKAGLISINNNGTLTWGKSKVLLAYFCGRIYCDDVTETDNYWGNKVWKQRGILPNKPLRTLFNEDKDINPSRNKNKGGTPPTGHEIIDNLFEAAD